MPRRFAVLAVLPTLALVAALAALLPAQTSYAPPDKDRPKDKDGGAATASDIEKVERLIAARREYQQSLEGLRTYYISTGDMERARWAEDELLQFHRITKESFRIDMELPPPNLQSNYNIPEANEIYKQAMTFKDKGWGTDYVDNQRRAEKLLQQLLTDHPQSDKISDAAYQLGDIYESKANKQYDRAAHYFERCFQWNPKTQFDARLRAARLYERNVGERNHAIDIYREIVNRETDPKRIDEAQKRLAELSAGK
jgi:TolA-binding protein